MGRVGRSVFVAVTVLATVPVSDIEGFATTRVAGRIAAVSLRG